ncbi:MAG: ABC transporter permease [Oscillospiraceae bacterium]|nr:ABC transporter permease [Oscillospiraceae bacterium]
MSLLNLFSRMPSACAQGILWGLMALGVYITFRVLDIADLSVDGTFATGGAVTVMLIIAGYPAWLALIVAILAGIAAGLCTGLLHTRLGIPAILSGILTQFALYSVNLHIMGMKANQTASLKKYGMFFENGKGFLVSSRYIPAAIGVGLALAVVVIMTLYLYFGTEQGSAIRATGSNHAMASAQGININNMKVLGLAISNGIVALSGGLMTQFQGTADVNIGRGAIVIGLASIIIGEVFCDLFFRKGANFAIRMSFVVFGGILYYAAMTIILWLKMDPNDLKLFTAIIVAIFLAVPYLKAQAKTSFSHAGKQAALEGKGEK